MKPEIARKYIFSRVKIAKDNMLSNNIYNNTRINLLVSSWMVDTFNQNIVWTNQFTVHQDASAIETKHW